MSAYQKLKDHSIQLSNLQKALAVLEWDSEVMMPPQAVDERGAVMATLGGVHHEKKTDPALAALIDQAETEDLGVHDRRNLLLMKEEYLQAVRVPNKLVSALETARNKATHVWQEAKPKSDWNLALPALRELLSLIKERAAIYGDILGCDVYDGQLNSYARGNRQAKIDPLFDMLKQEMPPLIQQIVEKQKDFLFKSPVISVEIQKKIAHQIAKETGFDLKWGRMDVTEHPFSTGTKNDVRITINYKEENSLQSISSVLHETGHALYTQNMPAEWYGQPVVFDSDMSLHESQSLIRERQAGLSADYIRYIHGLISSHDPGFAKTMDAEGLVRLMHQVTPSYIRIEADEVTYPLHVVLRYEIEKKLFSGKLDLADVPEVWNAEFKTLMGMDVPENRFGCLQDIHWFVGLFGYFPTYTQGALYAAQLYASMRREKPEVEAELAQGDFTTFNKWLTEKIHSQGQLYDAADLIERATGAKPSAQYFLDHLKNRYL